jgi:hypothetical protein
MTPPSLLIAAETKKTPLYHRDGKISRYHPDSCQGRLSAYITCMNVVSYQTAAAAFRDAAIVGNSLSDRSLRGLSAGGLLSLTGSQQLLYTIIAFSF